MKVPIFEYSKLEEWESHFGDSSRNLGDFEDAFNVTTSKNAGFRNTTIIFCFQRN